MEIISWIIIISFFAFWLYYCKKSWKKLNLYEKISYILCLFVYIIPFIIYLLDKYNIPTYFKYAKYVDVDRWFDFITSYTAGVVGAIISGTVLFLITRKQIQIQVDENNDNKRIQNAPVFDYEVRSWLDFNIPQDNQQLITQGKKGKINYLYFKIENIGLNHAKNVKFIVNYNGQNGEEIYLDYHQSFLRKDHAKWERLIFRDDKKEIKEVTIEVRYDDLISNSYIQKLKVVFETTNSSMVAIKDLTVDDAYLVDKEGK